MPKPVRGLGRGLDALLPDDLDIDIDRVVQIEIEKIIPAKDQPRKNFSEETIKELAESIQSHGLLQPLLVRPANDKYEIIAGERRWRAAKLCGMEMVPVLVKDIDDREKAEISLIENLQREDLSVVEEALAFRKMTQEYGYTQEQVAKKIGKSRVHVTNTMRIMALPQPILNLIEEGRLTAGHARTLLAISDSGEQLAAAREIAAKGLSVRETEKLAKKRKKTIDIKIENKWGKPAEIVEIEERLQKFFSSRVDVVVGPKGGKIQIEYYNEEDLQRIIEIIGLDTK